MEPEILPVVPMVLAIPEALEAPVVHPPNLPSRLSN